MICHRCTGPIAFELDDTWAMELRLVRQVRPLRSKWGSDWYEHMPVHRRCAAMGIEVKPTASGRTVRYVIR